MPKGISILNHDSTITGCVCIFAPMQLPSHISQTILETERLFLYELTPDVIYHIYTEWNDDDIKSYLGIQSPEELAIEKDKFKKGFTTHAISFKNFTLVDKVTGFVIGKCGFHTWFQMHSRAEIGYAMVSDTYKRQGYMKEAIAAIVKFGFEHMALNRIEALIGPKNEASIKLVTGLGFTKEGIAREHYCKNGIIQDSVSFAILKREYQS